MLPERHAAAVLLFVAILLGEASAATIEERRSPCTATAEEVTAAQGAALLRLRTGQAESEIVLPDDTEAQEQNPRARLEAAREAALETRAGTDRAEVTLLRFDVVETFGLDFGDEVMLSVPDCKSTTGYYLMLPQEGGASRMVPVAGPGDPLVAAARR